MKVDLHIHTKYSSDSFSELTTIMKRTKELGIIPAITDHNNIDAHKELKMMNFEFIPGCEIRTEKNGDLIGLYLNEKIKKNTHFLEVIDSIKSQGGLSYLPHMYDPGRGFFESELAKKVDIIEVYNSRCMLDIYNQKAREFAMENKKYFGAGSDAHFIYEIGNAYVEIPMIDISEPKNLLKGLKKGKIFGKKTVIFTRVLTRTAAFAKKAFRILRNKD